MANELITTQRESATAEANYCAPFITTKTQHRNKLFPCPHSQVNLDSSYIEVF